VGYIADNIKISMATAQITKMHAAISSTHATPEDVYAVGEKSSGVLVFKVKMKA
jgi:hypothetical protein